MRDTSLSVSVILLAGGSGQRMQSAIPKQYLLLGGKPIARYSFDCFLQMEGVEEIIVVCEECYHHHFTTDLTTVDVRFALPGKRRQDSVWNGLHAQKNGCSLVCVHDTARPFITPGLVSSVLEGGKIYGAAALAVPVKSTIKQGDPQGLVIQTLARASLWEVQTPQVARTDFLRQAFDHVIQHNIDVTDDVSLIEILGHPVKLIESHDSNIKITTPEDLLLANLLLEKYQHASLQEIEME